MYSLVASAINHPDEVNELWGLFNARSLESLAASGVSVEALVPRPYAPPIGPFSRFWEIPRTDDRFAYPVSHPRFVYYLPKSLLYHRTGDSIVRSYHSYDDQIADADVLHGCHLYPDAYALSEFAPDHGVPLTAYAHGTIVNEFGSFNTGTQERIRDALDRIDHVFCSGRAVQDGLQRIHPEVRTSVVPIGADPKNFPIEDRETIRRDFGVEEDDTLVLFVGHLTEKKGVADLLSVLPSLADTSLSVTIIGHDGDLRADAENALESPDSPSGTVEWQLDPVDVRRWFAAADLLVLPSYSEGRPTVVYEAMASGTPVLATTVGGIPEQVVDEETGWLFEPGDTDALREHLLRAASEPLAEMGAAGQRRLVEQGWTWSAHAEKITDVHRELLAARNDDARGRPRTNRADAVLGDERNEDSQSTTDDPDGSRPEDGAPYPE